MKQKINKTNNKMSSHVGFAIDLLTTGQSTVQNVIAALNNLITIACGSITALELIITRHSSFCFKLIAGMQ